MKGLQILKKTIKEILGYSKNNQHWCRVVMDNATEEIITSLKFDELRVLEISGNKWTDFGFKSYQSVNFPEFDICADLSPEYYEQYDLIIAEQVFEHLKYPKKAAKNVYQLLRSGGYFLISTPFLIKRHDFPIDCSRWTATGLSFFLETAGFYKDNIQTYSWGNKSCVKANLQKWIVYNRYLHSLKNELEFPIVVWGISKK